MTPRRLSSSPMPRTTPEASAASLGPALGHGAAIADLDRAWATPASGPRLRAVRVAAEGLRHRFAAGPRAVSVRTLPLVALPYPMKFAFFGAALSAPERAENQSTTSVHQLPGVGSADARNSCGSMSVTRWLDCLFVGGLTSEPR